MPQHNTQLICTLNVGQEDQVRLAIPNSPQGDFPPLEGDVISVDSDQAAIILRGTSAFKVYDAEEERKRREAVEKHDEDVMRPAVEARLAAARVEQKVEQKSRTTAKLPPQTTHIDRHAEEHKK